MGQPPQDVTWPPDLLEQVATAEPEDARGQEAEAIRRMTQPIPASAGNGPPTIPPQWLFYRERGPNWNSYVFRSRFVDIRLAEGAWQADEVCDDAGVGFWLATADTELEAFLAVERLWTPPTEHAACGPGTPPLSEG